MADLFTLNPAATSGDLIDELNGRLSAGVEAILEHDTSLTQSQWAGIHSLQQCVQIAEALGRARSDAAPAAGEAAPAAAITSPAGAHRTIVREALSAASDFMGAIIYMADGAMSKGPDFESLAYLEGIKALAEKTAAAIEPAAHAIATPAPAPADVPSPAPAAGGEDETAAGARVVVDLLHTIKGISDATAGHPGGRDYADMQDAIDAALLDGTCGSSTRRRGFVLALADLLCINADGGCVPERWEPLASIAREGQRPEGAPSPSRTGGAVPTPPPAQPDDPAAANIPGPVARLARECTYEVAALMQSLAENYGQVETEDQRPLVVRGMALRAHQLNSQVMSILDAPDLHARPAEVRSLTQAIMGEHSAFIGGDAS